MPSTSPMASGGTITIDASSCDPTGGIAGIEGIFSAPSHGTASVDAVAETVTYTNNGDGATTDFFTFGDPDSNAITVTVSIGAATSPITVTPASLPTPQVGVAYSPVTLIASGGTGPYTYTKTGGSLPPGMTFAGGTFSGTPTHWANYSVSIEVADSAGHSTTKSYALDVPQPTITLSSLPSPAVGVSYNQTITASGGTSPYGNFSVSSGSLPPNLSLSSSGVLSGTPTTAGTYHFVVQAADSSAPTTYYGTHTYDLTVNNATVPGAPTIGTATAGNALAHVSFSPPASNGGAAISSYTAISHPGNLSGNCTSSPCTVNGLTNGTAYTFTVTATNAVGTGAASSASNSVTPSTVPDAPTGVAAASTTSAQATVTFNAAIDNGSAITGYAVTSSPAGGIDANAGTTSLSHVMTGLANGVLYTFTVTATNANGAGPASSPSNSVMPKAAQTITFANPGTQNFGTTPTLTASATSGLTVTFTSTTTTVCTISSGGALAFIAAGTCTIDANQAGNGAYAAAPQVSQSFTVNGILPGAPIIGTATGSDQQATVNFTPPASSGGSPIVGYTATSSSGGNTGTCAASPCTVAGLVNGTSYTFTVTATNGVGTGAASAASNSVIPLGIPTASAKSATATYNTATTIDLTSSITGADITGITVGSGPSHGTATVSGETVTYTPAPSYYGSDSFTYTATNAAGTSTPATVTITVSPAPPSNLAYSPANYFFTKGQASTTATPTYDGTPLTGCTVSPALPTGLSIDTGNCEISGTPTSLSTAPIVYTVTASNPAGSTTAMVTITVNDVAPSNLVYTPGSYTFTQGQAITPATPTYVGGSMTSCTASPALPAGLSISPGNCTISGTPTVSAPSSSYTVIASNSGGSTTAMVTINVLPTAPTVANTSATAAYNTAATIDLTSSITGADITGITVGSGPLHGTTSVSGKTVTYTPSPTYYGGSDSFTYTATNPGGTSTPATVTITVTPPPAPTVANASMTAAYNTTATIDLTSSITGADVTGITVGSGPSHGTVTISGKTVTYTPSSSYYGGSDSFTYTATNPGGTSAPATVSITVGVPAAPTVVAKSVATAYNTPATIDLTGSITGVGITAVTIGMAPAHGTVSVSGETVTYTPSPTYYGGSDSFTYTATNPGGTSAPATVTISVSAPAAPVVTPKSVTTAYNTAASIDLTSSITGVDITAVTIGTAPTHGTVSVSGKVVTYTPSATYYGGADSFTYTATNPGGTSSPATVSITVGAPAAPVVAAKPVTTAYNTA
ncbi:beta strand repeat-containing protein, partial [Rhodanobacter glycinis]